MIEAVFAIPGDLATPTGGYLYDRRVMALLPERGLRVRHLALPPSFPDPSAADLDATDALIATTPPRAIILFDGLAYGAIPATRIARYGRDVVALVHHPLALETGLTEARRRDLLELERGALAQARHVIVTSASTAQTVVDLLGVSHVSITCAEPGTDAAARADGGGSPPHILSVGAIVPRKGCDLLVEALAHVADLPWRATFVGALDRAPDHVRDVRARIDRLGLTSRVRLVGALRDAALEEAYAGADIFVSASWHEGFGMALTEAMARGLPLVTTTGGAADTTAPSAAALKVSPGDMPGLASAMRRLLADPSLRRRLADAAWTHAQTLPRWTDTADRVAAVLRRVALAAAPP